ncbi:Calcium-dependent protein kinase 15 [Holothuria leucospilota]|uniref:non-specific serine/threonine protein kinase n=1 Tax=Holothuria leucospilota TaxID=206669 RepID=A0A9Q1HEN3_HOLLE|nr:Calcium-dependent protein kinase 15 [Holothuria leucospilota]
MASAGTGPHFTSLVTGKTISTSQRTKPRLKISKKRPPCLVPSLHSETYVYECVAQDITLDDTTALNTASIFSDCFSESQRIVSESSSEAELRDNRDFGYDESFPSWRLCVDFDKWYNFTKNTNETDNSGLIPQAAEPVIGLGDAPHLVKNILKGLSVEGNHQTFKSIPPTCPVIRPLDLTDVADNRNHPTILGEGSFGVVQLMKHLPTMRLCAVKIPKEDLKRDRMYENFYREVNVLSSLRGLDCVPQLFGVSRAGSNLDVPVLVQQFIGDPFTYESITLQSAILRKLLSSRKALCIALQVCYGVREIHSRGILHCDLKVDNIILLPGFIDAKYPKVKIIDFGMAVTLNGSPRYEIVPVQYLDEVGKQCLHIAPEVLRGQKPYSEASEIYSLGLVLKNLAEPTGTYLKDLGQKCMGQEGTRLQLKDIINSLESKVSSHYNPV